MLIRRIANWKNVGICKTWFTECPFDCDWKKRNKQLFVAIENEGRVGTQDATEERTFNLCSGLLLVTFSFFLSFLFLWRMTTDQSYKSRATFDWGLTVGSHINRNLHSFTIFSFFLDGNFFIRNDEDGLDLLLGRCHSERQHGELFSFYFHSFTQIHCHSFTKIGKFSLFTFLIAGNNPSFHVFSFKCWLQRKIEYYLRLNSSIILSFSNWQVSGYFLCKFCIEKCSNMMNENAVKKSYIFFTSWFFVSQIIKILWSYGKQGKCKSATFTNYQIYGKDFFLCLTLMRFKEKRIFPAR